MRTRVRWQTRTPLPATQRREKSTPLQQIVLLSITERPRDRLVRLIVAALLFIAELNEVTDHVNHVLLIGLSRAAFASSSFGPSSWRREADRIVIVFSVRGAAILRKSCANRQVLAELAWEQY